MEKLNFIPEVFNYTGNPKVDLEWLKHTHQEIFNEVIVINEYQLTRKDLENTNVIDIGANVGMFSLYAAYLGAKKVIAAEPATNTFNVLKENVESSKFKNIQIYKNAVLNVAGARINLPLQSDSGHNSLFKPSENFEIVETITLSHMLSQLSIDGDIILKIDCEGSEYDILLNTTTEELARVKTIHIEIHSDMHPLYKNFDILENKIQSFGFTKVRENRMYGYIRNEQGEVTNSVPLPVKVCCFERT